MQGEGSSRVHPARITELRAGEHVAGPVICWMSRDQRVRDNWALLHAQDTALQRSSPLAVVFCVVPAFLSATYRQYGFMLRGLEETERRLGEKGIPFFLLNGEPCRTLPDFLKRHGAGLLVTDFDPLRIKRAWKRAVARAITAPFFEVDAHNIVPCTAASPRAEYGAYTIRPKLRRLLPEFLTDYPPLLRHPHSWKGRVPEIDWLRVRAGLKVDRTVGEVNWVAPGERAAAAMLRKFLRKGLTGYDSARNDPNKDGQSGLSPYLHFGHLSAQRVALEVMRCKATERSKEAFLEELITRRELSDNFCFYNPDYDSPKVFPAWAQRTLAEHRKDRREHKYSQQVLEAARTHDELWNAAQMEMVQRGKMHGYLRMYWAKKILEWTRTPEEAMRIAIHLNDRYELDGRDPNGYAGIAWSIGGVHDRPWGTRKVFGMVRYMSEKGCRTKFDVDAYIRKVKGLK